MTLSRARVRFWASAGPNRCQIKCQNICQIECNKMPDQMPIECQLVGVTPINTHTHHWFVGLVKGKTYRISTGNFNIDVKNPLFPVDCDPHGSYHAWYLHGPSRGWAVEGCARVPEPRCSPGCHRAGWADEQRVSIAPNLGISAKTRMCKIRESQKCGFLAKYSYVRLILSMEDLGVNQQSRDL